MSKREQTIRWLVVAAILAAVIAAFTGPAKAQVMNDKSTGYLDEFPMYPEDYPRRLDAPDPMDTQPVDEWALDGPGLGLSDGHNGESRLPSYFGDIFHKGGAVKIPEGSSCESCH